MKKLTVYLVAFLVANIISSCDREEPLPPVTNPQQAILGKWEIIENTFGPVDNPPGYDEYLPDSIRISYSYTDMVFYHEKYWLSDSLLFRSIVFTSEGDTIDFQWPYRFKFINYNKLKLEFLYPSLNPISIYKRLK
ncbi:MAG: hypothetical protein RBT74_10330 [Tenuifilaceae bacterium]|jgi:hypothetical protein|nr:hypothetical protein [Tenuifilaceae bacterium]